MKMRWTIAALALAAAVTLTGCTSAAAQHHDGDAKASSSAPSTVATHKPSTAEREYALLSKQDQAAWAKFEKAEDTADDCYYVVSASGDAFYQEGGTPTFLQQSGHASIDPNTTYSYVDSLGSTDQAQTVVLTGPVAKAVPDGCVNLTDDDPSNDMNAEQMVDTIRNAETTFHADEGVYGSWSQLNSADKAGKTALSAQDAKGLNVTIALTAAQQSFDGSASRAGLQYCVAASGSHTQAWFASADPNGAVTSFEPDVTRAGVACPAAP